MISSAHHLPGVAVVADVAAPRERLEADANAALLCPLAEFVQIRRSAVDAAERVGRDIAADHQKVAAQIAHQIELALGAGESAAALWLRHALEIAEGLKRDDLESQRGHHVGDIARRSVERQKIVLENFDASEARRCDRLEFFRKSAAE